MMLARAMRWWVLTSLVALTATLLVAGAGPSRAGQPPPTSPSTVGAVISAKVAAGGVDDVLAHWTSRRMRDALPLDLDHLGRVITGGGPPAPGAAKAAGLTAPRSVGKLFFTDGAVDYVCSAAAINTKTKNLIITAGHCASKRVCGLLSGCAGQYYTNFLFVPRYANGSAPDGRWVGTQAITHQQWFVHENEAYDQALIKMAKRNGRTLVGVVGGSGLAWNFPARQNDIRVWGWPADTPYDGETVRRCTGRTTRWAGTPDAGLTCPMTGGASGGPWFLSMRTSSVGYIWAVTSRRTTSGTPILLARPLTGAIRNLVRTANGLGGAVDPARGDGLRIPTSYAGPVVRRSGINLRAAPAHVGRGQVLEIRVKTAARRRTVLQVKYARNGAWHRVQRRTTGGAGTVTFRSRVQAGGQRWYRAYTSTRTSGTVGVRVHACPLPLERAGKVVAATGCTAPITR